MSFRNPAAARSRRGRSFCYTVFVITDKDIEKLKKTFITKKDLKKELKRFATKDDIEELDIRVAKSFNQNEQRMVAMEENISKLQEDVSEIKHNMLTMEDNIIGAINKLQIENSITATYRPKIENHEQRITKLEKVQFAN